MKTFNDLKFVKHPMGKGIQAVLNIEPDTIVSVIAGEGFYSNSKNGNKKSVSRVEDVFSFEVGIKRNNDENWEVVGWQSREDINTLLSIICK